MAPVGLTAGQSHDSDFVSALPDNRSSPEVVVMTQENSLTLTRRYRLTFFGATNERVPTGQRGFAVTTESVWFTLDPETVDEFFSLFVVKYSQPRNGIHYEHEV